MTARPSRRFTSRSSMRLAGAGAAGLAAVLAAAPAASAHAPASTPSAAPNDKAPNDKAADATVTRAAAAEAVAPDYGFQKYRVGVQIASGAYVPPGTTTVGSEITVTETGPNAPTTNNPFTCTTDQSTVQPGSTASYCLADSLPPLVVAREKTLARQAQVRPQVAGDPAEYFIVPPGDTITARQSSGGPNLVIDPQPQTLEPCEADQGGVECTDANGDIKATTLLFTDTGTAPVAKDDSATVRTGTTIAIAVLANDDPNAPVTKLSVSDAPRHGTAEVANEKIDYTPKPGFVGTDTFAYTVRTANGTATARVTLTVTAPPPTANADAAETTTGTPVTVNVLKNDDANGGGRLTLESVGQPAHGTTRVVDGRVLYTPAAGYAGDDHFSYTATTGFGSDRARVTVTVSPAPTQPTSPPPTAPAVANTGTPSETLLEAGVGLLLAGGATTVAGRRRRRGRHA